MALKYPQISRPVEWSLVRSVREDWKARQLINEAIKQHRKEIEERVLLAIKERGFNNG